METARSLQLLIFYDLALLLPNKPASTMSILPSSPSGMTSSETPYYKTKYYDCLQNVVARLYDTSHELCDVILAAQSEPAVALILSVGRRVTGQKQRSKLMKHQADLLLIIISSIFGLSA